MAFLLKLLSVYAMFCSRIGENSDLQQREHESFFDYAIRIKKLEINEIDSLACREYIAQPKVVTPYLKALQRIFQEQLAHRMGSAAEQRELVDRKVKALMRIFLKDKLGLHKPVRPAHDLAKRAKWDPHYHGSSLFADVFPRARLYLPNYEEAYGYMTSQHRALKDRLCFVRQAMEAEEFATITEAGSSYDKWHIFHAGKRIIPIFCHKRDTGQVVRHDVLGYDLCGLEREDEYQSQQEFFQSLRGDKVVRVHMGETIVPARGRDNVRLLLDEAEKYYTSSKPLRIGHGTHASIEDMIRIAQKGYYIEACLSSNKRTGILDKRSEYSLGIMLLLGVPVVIGTDGGRLYSTTLPDEYAHAVRNLEKFHDKLQHSDDPILLTNGDRLLYRHILPFVQEERRAIASERSGENMTYRELGACLDPAILHRISVETLVSNANTLLDLCY